MHLAIFSITASQQWKLKARGYKHTALYAITLDALHQPLIKMKQSLNNIIWQTQNLRINIAILKLRVQILYSERYF